MMTADWKEDTMPIAGVDVDIKYGELPHRDLKFYVQNPRLHTLIGSSPTEYSQEDIEKKLREKEHVRELRTAIHQTGGLTDPILVRDGDLTVLEGNSRLAAYRILAEQDPIRWAKMRVILLPADLSDELVFALLGQYHIVGKTPWQPYEQAGYLWRRNKHQGIDAKSMAKEIGMTAAAIENRIDVYDFMVNHDDQNPARWSYYEEYLKKRPIKRVREGQPEFDELVVSKIKSGEISTAIEIREKLAPICDAGGRALKKFKSGEGTFDEAFELTSDRGEWFKRLERFRKQIGGGALVSDYREMEKSERDKVVFEAKRILREMNKILETPPSPGNEKPNITINVDNSDTNADWIKQVR